MESTKGEKYIPLMESTESGMRESRDWADPGALMMPRKKQFKVKYWVIFWTCFWLVSLWAIFDRFFWNLYPMTINFPPLIPALESKGVPPHTISGAIVFFDGFGRATGRLIITVFAALFWTQVKTTENFMMEHSPKWVDFGDIRTIHNRIHYILGVFFMGIPLVLHCLLIFLPSFAGIPLHVGMGAPPAPGVKVSPFVWANPNSTQVFTQAEMFITFDNIYRATLTVLLFCILFPFSMSNYGRKRWFSATQFLHLLCVTVFSIDLLRKAPHTQVFSSPVIAYYIVDRIVGYWYYRTGEATIIHKEQLDEDYVALFLYVPNQKRRRRVGSTYYVQMKGTENMLDIAHPYVAFQNHSQKPLLPEWTNRDESSSQHKFYIDRASDERRFQRRDDSTSSIDFEDETTDQPAGHVATSETEDVIFFSNWNTCIVMQVHRWNSEKSFTARVCDLEVSQKIRFWGPYLTEYGEMTPDGRHYLPPIVAIGTGAGVGPLLDFYLHISANNLELQNPVVFYFTTNSIGLFQFFTDLTCSRVIPNLSVNAHLTRQKDTTIAFDDNDVDNSVPSSARESSASEMEGTRMKLGRLSFMEVLQGCPPSTEVFFCGAPALQWRVEVACKVSGLTFKPGHRFAGDGIIGCKQVGPCNFVCLCNKFPLCLVY